MRSFTIVSLYRQHSALCFERAFPRTVAEHHRAVQKLHAFYDTVGNLPGPARERLHDTGIAGTPVNYAFSFEVARWLAKNCPGEVSIDWAAIDDTTRLDEILRQLIQPCEDEYFDSGYVSTQEWIDVARTGLCGTDFDWLLAQLRDQRLRSVWTQLYDAADIPLTWQLGNNGFSKSRNALRARPLHTRDGGMRGRPRHPKSAVLEPVAIRRLSARAGARLVDVAMASLAVRHRETWHFNYANAAEVYVADVGEGVSVAVFGLLPEHRYPLETTLGFLILSNGVPVGYGGSSIVFKQINTGINIFDEYRGSEAAFLWTQVMRVYHSLTGCTRFIANAFQFGSDNDEALHSGAFWFYYRLGYRPVRADVRGIARREVERMSADPSHRSNLNTLRKLASCDMHLTLPRARAGDLFDEDWLTTSSMLASRILAAEGARTHDDAADAVAARLARDIGLRGSEAWSAQERRSFRRIAPFAAAAEPRSWPPEDKRALRKLLRSKGGKYEATYAKLLCEHDKFLNSLGKACRRASRE